MTEREFSEFAERLGEKVAGLSLKDQRRVVIRHVHALTVQIRWDLFEKQNLGNIQMANEYLHQLAGWLSEQEQGGDDPYPASAVVARIWDAYQRSKSFDPAPDLDTFAKLLEIA